MVYRTPIRLDENQAANGAAWDVYWCYRRRKEGRGSGWYHRVCFGCTMSVLRELTVAIQSLPWCRSAIIGCYSHVRRLFLGESNSKPVYHRPYHDLPFFDPKTHF